MTKNIWSKFKSNRIVDGKPRNVIVDICGDIINRSPSKEELKGLKRHLSVKDILKLPEEEKKKYLLEFLRYFYNKEGRSPRESDFNNNPKYPTRATYWRIFGSWNNAIEVAGLEPKIAGGQSYTNEELLRYLIQFYEENGRSPTMEHIRKNYKYPGFSVYQQRFRSWQNALKLVGLDLDSMVRRGIIET